MKKVQTEISESITDMAGSSSFMSAVYLWMGFGLILTSGVSLYIESNSEILFYLYSNRAMFWIIFALQIAGVLLLSFRIEKLSLFLVRAIFLSYAMLTGITLSLMLHRYTADSVASIFVLSIFSFLGLSIYGFVTRHDLGPIGSFCLTGLFGLVGYGLVSLFVPDLFTSVSEKVYSTVGIVVFAGLTAYDTQKLKELSFDLKPGSKEYKQAVIAGALTLYLDFINLFLKLLRLLGKKKD